MMKKAIKKLLAALLAVAMVCAMAIPAFAYNPGETKEDLNTNAVRRRGSVIGTAVTAAVAASGSKRMPPSVPTAKPSAVGTGC